MVIKSISIGAQLEIPKISTYDFFLKIKENNNSTDLFSYGSILAIQKSLIGM